MTNATETEQPVNPAQSPTDDRTATPPTSEAGGPVIISYESLSVIAVIVALAAVVIAVFSMAVASRSIDEHRSIPAGGGAAATSSVSVTLDEFGISPSNITMPAGSKLKVTNDGAVTHNFIVEDKSTPDLATGESAELDTSALAPGSYTVYCTIAGHREAGMEAQLTVT